MTLDQVFEDHIKLAVRVLARRPLRPHRPDAATAQALSDELRALEQTSQFEDRSRTDGFEEARYAVDALIDSAADATFKDGWTRRNIDAHVGHNFYTRLIAAHERGTAAREVLDVYVLCALLGFTGDVHARSQDKVLRAVADATRRIRPLSIRWSPAPWSDDGMSMARSHRFFAATAMITVVTYCCWLAVLWGLRVAFGL